MATFTTNYNLRKPATTDFVTVSSDVNANMDTIDTQIKTRQNNIDTIQNWKNDRFILEKNAVQSIANLTDTDVIWQTEVEDPNGLVTAGAAFTTFTVPSGKAGVYAHSVCMHWDSPAAQSPRGVRIIVNGILVAHGEAPYSASVNNGMSNCSAAWTGYLAVGDTVVISVIQNSGGALNIENQSSLTRTTRWTCVRIG